MELKPIRLHKTLPMPPTEPPTVLKGPQEASTKARQAWKPPTMRLWYLAALLLLTYLLITIVVLLVVSSNRNRGIIFAQDVNELPISKSFCYLYLPTIISVFYGSLWTWLDLDIKRLEPYYQLSNGPVSGQSSILLSYPLEFLATVPFSAFARRQWAVCSGATTMILIFWGLTPIQAGMFATRNVVIRENIPASQSQAYTPTSNQGNLTIDYAQSTYNIAWLSEKLHEYMTKDYVLAPFGPERQVAMQIEPYNFTAPTVLYSVDIKCEEATLWEKSEGLWYYNSTRGCSYYPPSYRPGGGEDLSKPFDTLYVGYQNQNGFADYYLSPYCKTASPSTFFLRWSRSNDTTIRNANGNIGFEPNAANATSLYCEPTYYKQLVRATITWPEKVVLGIQASGDKTDLPKDMFNVSTFEWAMSSGQAQFTTRGDYPTSGFPDQKSQLIDLPLNLEFLPKMSPFAIATYPRPLEDYLNPEHLRLSYQAAYRLLFARQLSDILLDDRVLSNQGGERLYNTQAIIVVSGFAYAVIAILSMVSLVGTALLIHLPRRLSMLHYDPATIGALMDLTSGRTGLIKVFGELAHSGEKAFNEALAESTFHLNTTAQHCATLPKVDFLARTVPDVDSKPHSTHKTTADEQHPLLAGVRPFEMKLVIGLIFFLLQIAAFSTFLALYVKAQTDNGLALPSQSTFVRQLLQNYIPIALATLMEPFWLLLNKYLSMLQPFEELRQGMSCASRTVDLDYSSLPPQFLFVRAIRARHFIMALVCLMVLLTNVLSVALSGLMYEGARPVPSYTTFQATKAARFRQLNGTGLPFNSGGIAQTSQGGTTNDPFYRMMSNLTANTPLPPWTDTNYAYVPLSLDGVDANDTVEVTTVGFRADLDCRTLSSPADYTLDFYDPSGTAAALTVSVPRTSGSSVACTDKRKWTGSWLGNLRDPQDGRVAFELATMLGSNATQADDLYCRQHFVAGWLRVDWRTTSGEVGQGSGIAYYDERNMTITSRNDTMLLCSPQISAWDVAVKVQSNGAILESRDLGSPVFNLYNSSSADLQAQANYFITDLGATWHKDAYPSDFLNYLIKESTNDSSLLDYEQPVPDDSHASYQLGIVYRKLFAILVGSNFDLLLEDVQVPSSASTEGRTFHTETRILFSTPAFILTESIFGLSILLTIVFYARRPWKVLPRLPSSPASIIAYFANGHALRDLADSGVKQHIEAKKWRSERRWQYVIHEEGGIENHIGINCETIAEGRIERANVDHGPLKSK